MGIVTGHRARTALPVNFTIAEIGLLLEALAMAASRHESQGHVTKGSFRAEHDEKARLMRELRERLGKTK
jgi:hypothetical protein